MIYAPDTPGANRFPWRMFLSQTRLRKGAFKGILNDEDFLREVADSYEDKGDMLTDDEVYECVKKVYFPMFKKMFLSKDVFWAAAIEDDVEFTKQPRIEGFVFDRFATGTEQNRRTKFRNAVKTFSKDLYGDPHAWFEDFEKYFRATEEDE